MSHPKLWVDYVTADGKNKYPIKVGYKKINFDDIVYDPTYIRSLCEVGCKNYNHAGGCPPFSPLFETLHRKGQSLFLVYGTFYPEFKTEKVKKSESAYIHFRLQDQILSRLFYNLGLCLTEKTGCIFLGTGFCMGCGSKKCSYKEGILDCRNPTRRSYSMESTGINVEATLKETVEVQLYWYGKNSGLDIPLTKASLFMFDSGISEAGFKTVTEEALSQLGMSKGGYHDSI